MEPTQAKFWTLPKKSTQNAQTPVTVEEKSSYGPKSIRTDSEYQQKQHLGQNDESIRISPIDPRTSGTFKSSTPSNKENVVDLSSKLLSPVKSTMTNEELYAVIHKSKKKLNIKDQSSERAASPALSVISLSPVNSEPSLHKKSTQRYPESGYLGDVKNRSDGKNGPSPNHYGPYFLQKQETCADRYGPLQQTSRLDFKKLLLQHSVKLNTLNTQAKTSKLSAVEQLKLSKEKPQIPVTPPGNKSHVNILDLSGSPKTYNHRKIIKSSNQPTSPGRINTLLKDPKSSPKILLSPKSQWRFASPRSDVLSTPIPEVNNEDENSNSSGEKNDNSLPSPSSKTVPIVTHQHFGARRSLIPINEHKIVEEQNVPATIEQGVYPIASEYTHSQALSRSEIIQAKRAEFFNTIPEPTSSKLTSFKSSNRSNTSPERGKSSPSTLETAL